MVERKVLVESFGEIGLLCGDCARGLDTLDEQ